MFILQKGHQPGVYVPLRALFLVYLIFIFTTTMTFKLIYFYPTETFMVKVKVTESLTEIGNFENIC